METLDGVNFSTAVHCPRCKYSTTVHICMIFEYYVHCPRCQFKFNVELDSRLCLEYKTLKEIPKDNTSKSTTKEKEVEMTSAIKEDVQTVQQILGALQQDKLLVVTVKFPNNSEKEYYYKTLDDSIEVGSHVVIDSPFSGIIALPVETIANAKTAGVSNQLLGSLKWVVQKVDFTNYLDNTAQEKQVKEDLLKSIEAKRAQDVLEYARQTFGAGVNAVLDGYVNGLSNGANIKVLEAPKEKKVVGRGRQTGKTIASKTKE